MPSGGTRYCSSALSGKEEAIGVHRGRILDICRALRVEPAEFFALAFPKNAARTLAGEHLRDTWSRLNRSGPAASVQTDVEEEDDPWRIMELAKEVEAAVGGTVLRWIRRLTEPDASREDREEQEELPQG